MTYDIACVRRSFPTRTRVFFHEENTMLGSPTVSGIMRTDYEDEGEYLLCARPLRKSDNSLASFDGYCPAQPGPLSPAD